MSEIYGSGHYSVRVTIYKDGREIRTSEESDDLLIEDRDADLIAMAAMAVTACINSMDVTDA